MIKDNIDFKPEFANWNQFYTDLFTQITKIREVSATVMFKLDDVKIYFSLVNSLFNTHSHYVYDSESYESKLDKMSVFLFSNDYEKGLKTNNSSIREQQIKIIRDLNKIFKHMCTSFARYGLSVKVNQQNKKLSQDITLTEEEREEIEALEEIGIM
jgi:hypothetical protein